VFGNPSEYIAVDQWQDDGVYPIRRGMIGVASVATGDVRLLVAHDGVGTGYNTGGQVHPTLSPDGKFLMWVSNMNGSSRFDTFLARIPTR
jgi:WD40-like Beta Propeller Repeat